jgi:hypothetical protein
MAFVNPLGSLYTNGSGGKYDFNYLHYPIKFDDILQQGHYMNFYINAHKGSGYTGATPTKRFKKDTGPGLFGINSLSSGSVASAFSFDSVSVNAGSTLFGSSGTSFPLSGLYQRISSAISLYIPLTMSFTGNVSWEGDSASTRFGLGLAGAQYLAQAPGAMKSIYDTYKAGGDMTKTLRTVAGNNEALFRELSQFVAKEFDRRREKKSSLTQAFVGEDWFLRKGGFAVNPQLMVLYRTTSLRQFQFSFTFTPVNETEAATVRNIIKMFRFHASPEVVPNDATGRFHIAPSTFDIEFFHKTSTNENIQKIGSCVLNNYSVNYAPAGGWTTHTDGMPVQTTLDLSFMETQLITKDLINSGF